MRPLRSAKAPGSRLIATVLATLLVAGAAHGGQEAPQNLLMRKQMMESLWAECASADPELAPRLQAERNQWVAANALGLSRADATVAALPDSEKARLATALDAIDHFAREQFAVARDGGQSGQICGNVAASFGDESTPADAESYAEARELYRTLTVMAQEVLPECGRLFPASAPSFASAQEAWRDRDAGVIATIDAFARENEGKTVLVELDEVAIRVAHGSLESAFNNGTSEQFCRSFFDDLATGSHRVRLPKMYDFLENGPFSD